MKYAKWEDLCSTYSEEHAIAALGKNDVISFHLKEGTCEQLHRLDNVLFAKRPEIRLSVTTIHYDEKPGKHNTYTNKEFELLAQLKHLRKLSVSIAVKQDFRSLSIVPQVDDLCVYVGVNTDLCILENFPNISNLHLSGKFNEVASILKLSKIQSLSLSGFKDVDFSCLKNLSLKNIYVSSCSAKENFSVMLSGSVEYLTLSNIKRAENIDFIKIATNLRKLYLDEFILPVLPDFSQNKKLTILQINEMHKLDNVESLITSNIEYLFVLVSSDKVSGTSFAEILSNMKMLKKALMRLMDRNDKRYNVLKRSLEKQNKADLLADSMNFFEMQ